MHVVWQWGLDSRLVVAQIHLGRFEGVNTNRRKITTFWEQVLQWLKSVQMKHTYIPFPWKRKWICWTKKIHRWINYSHILWFAHDTCTCSSYHKIQEVPRSVRITFRYTPTNSKSHSNATHSSFPIRLFPPPSPLPPPPPPMFLPLHLHPNHLYFPQGPLHPLPSSCPNAYRCVVNVEVGVIRCVQSLTTSFFTIITPYQRQLSPYPLSPLPFPTPNLLALFNPV